VRRRSHDCHSEIFEVHSIHGMHLSRNFLRQSGDNQALAHLQMRPILSCNMIQHFSSESSCQEIRPDQLRELKEKLVAGRDDEAGDNV